MIPVMDFHSHILPQMDDGSRSVEESLAMLELAAGQGIQKMAATPHFYAQRDTLDNFLRRREAMAKRLRNALAARPDLPQVILGAEVYYFSGIGSTSMLPELAMEGTGCVLVEMPASPWTPSMYRELEKIRENLGLNPVVAHIDRYIRPHRTYGIPEQLRQRGILVQANASFFLRWETTAMAMGLLREEKIHFLGSDCHNMEDRKPNQGLALEKIEKKLGTASIARLHSYEQKALECGLEG